MDFWQNYCLIPVKRHQNNRPVPSNDIVPISLLSNKRGTYQNQAIIFINLIYRTIVHL